MRAAIICAPAPRPDAPRPGDGRAGLASALELPYALALARQMADFGLEPQLICAPGAAGALDADGALGRFRLWRWQRRQRKLLVIALGARSLKIGRVLCKMKKPGDALLALYFPLAAAQGASLRGVQLCLCGSERIQAQMERLAEADKGARLEFAIAAPGIDIDAYAIARPVAAPKRFVFGMAESLLPDSGALLVVRAMAALWQHEDIPPWEVRMFGDGPRFAEIMAEAEKLGALARLSLLGDQPLADVAALCDAWLAPGASQDELPAALWAGSASGLPLACSDSPLHRERIWNPDAAIFASFANPQEMARAMLRLMRDPALRARMGAAGAAMRPKISLEGMADRVIAGLEASVAWRDF